MKNNRWDKYYFLIIAALAGLLYNSWFLAYWLNPHVVRIGLSSDLEASGQPYNWVFIASDVLCATLLLAVVWTFRSKKESLWLRGLAGYAVFAIMTAVSALLPLHCSADIRSCGFQAGQQFGLHDLASGLAALGLFFALLGAWLHNLHASKLLHYLSELVLLAWSLLGLLFLLATLRDNHVVGMQQLFLLLSGVAIWIVSYSLSSDKTQTTSDII